MKLDKVGATASSLCAIHCMIMPFIITILPLLGLGFLSSEWVEWTLFGLSAIIGISSLCLGYRKHKNRIAPIILTIGLAFLGLGRYAHEHSWGIKGIALLVIGGFTIAASHWVNHRLCSTCHTCQQGVS